MIKGTGSGKLLKQGFFISLISCFILLGGSFVNAFDLSDDGSLIDGIVNSFESLVNVITNIGKGILSFFSSLGNIVSGFISIIQAIFYGLTSLLTKVWNLAVQIFDGGVFTNVGRSFETLSAYIGGPATAFLGVMLFLIIVRIAIAFVFKIFRLNIDYHTDRAKTDKINAEEYKKSHNLFS